VARGLIRLSGRRLIDAKLVWVKAGEVPASFTWLGVDPSLIPSDTMAVWIEHMAGPRWRMATTRTVLASRNS
jgi:hypothetical protein